MHIIVLILAVLLPNNQPLVEKTIMPDIKTCIEKATEALEQADKIKEEYMFVASCQIVSPKKDPA